MKDKLLIVDVAGLGYDFLCRNRGDEWEGLKFAAMESGFPAVTCSVQASFRTASAPAQHGMIANGLWDRRYLKARFWEQSSALVEGERIWKKYREAGHTVGMLFWQQSMGEDVDVVLTPAPIHKHHGGMIQDCYCRPAGLYADLCRNVGRKFNLMNYWGPMASYKASAWIADATAALLADSELAPDLCLTYLPVLDYDLQRYGMEHPRSIKALDHLFSQLKLLKDSAEKNGYDLLIFGDYALADVMGEPVYPNRELLKHGLLSVRDIEGMSYPDFYTGQAFVMVDHEVGHVYVKDEQKIGEVRRVLEALPGVAEVLDREQQASIGIDHENSGELVILAEAGLWFAYPWWSVDSEAPDYASHVDIHNKPGYDPAELFWGWPPGAVSRRPERIGGTHGRAGAGRSVAWASTCIEGEPQRLVELAEMLRRRRLNL
jgi:predicted AlkP superfamily pyrophosphatase or phosphodiesterase